MLASVRGARAPLATLLREAADRPRVSRLAVAGETLVVAVAIAAVYQLRAGTTLIGTAGAMALLAPGLLATALSLLAIRVGAAAVKRRSAGPARSLAGLLVVRQFARVPSLLQRHVAVAIGAALLVFGTQLAALAARNQRLHADAIAGAATVLHVQVPPGMSLETAVRAADPVGTQAMAVEELPPSSGAGTSRVIAVDVSRLARVAVWHPHWAHLSAPRLAALLRPAAPGKVVLRGSEVGVSLTNTTVATNTEDSIGSDVGPNPGLPRAHLVLIVAALDGASRWQQSTLGTLHSGDETFHGNIACRSGCRLVQLQVVQESQTPFNVHFTIAALHTSQQDQSAFSAALRDAARWRAVLGTPEPGQPAQSTVSTTAQGLRVSMTSLPGDATSPAIAPADTPDPLPALLAAATTAPAIAGYPGTTPGVGLDGQQLLLRIVGRADVLPRSLDDGALVDLDTAAALADPGHDQASSEVWLAPGAHPGVERALAREGVQILGRERIATTRAALGQAAPARAIRADLAIAGAAALLAMFVLVVTRVIDADRRQRLWTVGRLNGFSRARLTRLAALEVGAPAIVATLIGALTGLFTVWLAGDRLPLFAAGTVGPPLDMTADWAVAGLTVAATLVIVMGVSLAIAATEAWHASPAGAWR